MTTNSDMTSSRRTLLAGAGGLAAAFAITAGASATTKETIKMTTVSMRDGTKIFYQDWGAGPVIAFSHGWPLSADAWDAQMMFFGAHGFRVIAHDRRGHGRSDQTWSGNDMDTYADDLATLLDHLDIKGVTLVGHSTGGGEVARYIGRHGTGRVARAALIAAVPPHLAQSADNPHGAPMEVFNGLRQNVLGDRAEFFRGLAMPFFGYNRPGAHISQGQVDSFWRQGMMGGVKAEYDCIKAFSETDFTADLKKMTMPTLVMQGDDDQIVPIDLASRQSVKILPHGTLKEVPGAPHGLTVTHADQVNAELMTFIRG